MARAHDDLFETARYTASFFNYSTGTYDPDSDEMTGQTRSQIGSANVEIVPPGQDTTVDSDGTSFDWTTSIRFPQSESFVSNLTPLGVDSTKPTEVEITDQVENNTDTFELHSYTTELGSGFVMARLVEK